MNYEMSNVIDCLGLSIVTFSAHITVTCQKSGALPHGLLVRQSSRLLMCYCDAM